MVLMVNTCPPKYTEIIMSGDYTGKVVYAHGAYGRVANRKDWLAGKDFKVTGAGPYLSIRDIELIKSRGSTHIIFVNPISFVIEFVETL